MADLVDVKRKIAELEVKGALEEAISTLEDAIKEYVQNYLQEGGYLAGG